MTKTRTITPTEKEKTRTRKRPRFSFAGEGKGARRRMRYFPPKPCICNAFVNYPPPLLQLPGGNDTLKFKIGVLRPLRAGKE